MSRRLKQDERFMRWAQERSRLFLTLRNAPIPEKLRAYKQLERRILKEARSESEKREMQRRISMDLLMAASDGPWRGFSPHFSWTALSPSATCPGEPAMLHSGYTGGRQESSRVPEELAQ